MNEVQDLIDKLSKLKEKLLSEGLQLYNVGISEHKNTLTFSLLREESVLRNPEVDELFIEFVLNHDKTSVKSVDICFGDGQYYKRYDGFNSELYEKIVADFYNAIELM